MTEQEYDFRLVGSLVKFVTDLDNVRHTRRAGEVWECRFCFSLTNAPDDHFDAVHKQPDETPGWNVPELRIER